MIAKDTQEREEWVGALNRCRNWEQRIRTDYERKLVLEQAAQHREEAHRSKVRTQHLARPDRTDTDESSFADAGVSAVGGRR